MRRLLLSVVALPMVLLVGCASDRRYSDRRADSPGRLAQPTTAQTPPKEGSTYWAGDTATGSARVKIDIGEQRAYFYKGDQLVGVSRVSTGRDGYRTPAGSFSVLDKNRHHISSLYGNFVDAEGNVVQSDVDVRTDSPPPGARFSGSPMPYFMRFNGGIGMHAGYLPGYPASHGCVRLPRHMAAHFFNNVEIGTPVAVTN